MIPTAHSRFRTLVVERCAQEKDEPMHRRTIIRTVATILSLLTMFTSAQMAQAAWEGDSGVAWVPIARQHAWAWVDVTGTTQGRAFARVGNAESDTGWFKQGKRRADATGPAAAQNVRHEYHVR